MKRLLLTAFEPFAGESINPSLDAARQMEKVEFPSAIVRIAELPVDRFRAVEIALELIRAERPDIVLIEFAANDADVTEFMSLSHSSANMTEIVSRLRDSKTRPTVYVMAMNPVSGLRGMIRPFLGQYEEAHAAIARKLGAGFIDHRPAWARLSDEEMAKAIADGAHPDPATTSRVIVPGLVRALAASGCLTAKRE